MVRQSSSDDERSGERPGPHRFKSRRDRGLAAFAAGSAGTSGISGALPPSAVTGSYLRQAACDHPGCGRPEFDPIHEPVEG